MVLHNYELRIDVWVEKYGAKVVFFSEFGANVWRKIGKYFCAERGLKLF
jgi:hypothetical protein